MEYLNNRKLLVVFCGPSSAGKDTIASIVRAKLNGLDINFSYLDKYTTRQPREKFENELNFNLSEPSSNYSFLSKKDFISNKDIVLNYNLYGFKYGFSKEHLLDETFENYNLICIYGDLLTIDKFKWEVERKYDRNVILILINACQEDLIKRLIARKTISENEIGKRLRILTDQSDLIKYNVNNILSEFNLVIENGDGINIDTVSNQIVNYIYEYITNISNLV